MMRVLLAAAFVVLAGCAGTPPAKPNDLCAVFDEKDDWFDEAVDSEERWNIPIPVMMSTIYQESGYQARAKPPRRKLLWIIPWKRPSSAYGYAQVLDQTWENYQDKAGGLFADRDDFGDAIDFVGWYHDGSARTLGIPRNDAYRLYLAYHEGQKGYQRGTHTKKPALLDTARKVESRSKTYASQLAKCREDLEGPWWWPF